MPISFIPTDETTEDPKRIEPSPGEAKKRRGRPPGSRTNASVETQIKDELTMLFGLGAMLWSARDPQCAGVFNQQGPLIAADLAKFAAKSKWARAYLQRVADVGEIIPLVMHVYPVVLAIHEHHVRPNMGARVGPVDDNITDMFDQAVGNA